jgi:hypothetical protein
MCPDQPLREQRPADSANDATRKAEARIARRETDPIARNAVAAAEFSLQAKIGNVSIAQMTSALTQLVQFGRTSTEYSECMLLAQANTLDVTFTYLLSRAATDIGHNPHAVEMMRLALKAQSQCRTTLEALAAIKNPSPTLFARQANFAQGHQQINNGTAPETENPPTELLERDHGKRLDTGAKSLAGTDDPVVATVGTVHRAKVAIR